MKLTTFFSILLFVENCVGYERIDEPYPSDLIFAAENSVHQLNILPEKILLLSIGEVLSKNSAKTECNMLSAPTMLNLLYVRGRQTDFSTILGLNLQVVVISRYDEALEPEADAFQFPRHKVLLHIITGKLRRGYQPTVPTLVWEQRGFRRFYCVHSFDNVIFWYSKLSSRSCQASTSTCELSHIKQLIAQISSIWILEVILEFQCNSTNLSAEYLANERYIGGGLHDEMDRHMKTQYFTYDFRNMECFFAYRMRPTDLTTLLLPFDLDAWFGTFFSALLTATVLSRTVGKRFYTISTEILLSFMAVPLIDIKLRQFSSLITACAIVILTSFINRIYSNCIMSVFLSPFVFVQPSAFASCKFRQQCRDFPQFIHSILDTGRAVCSLTEAMKYPYGKPLHRFLPPSKKSSRSYSPFWMLQRNPFSFRVHRNPSLCTHTLVFTRRSEIVNNLFQYGMIPLERFNYMHARKISTLWDEHLDLEARRVVETIKKLPHMEGIYSGSSEIVFDMQKFSELLPLFGLCLISTALCLAFEFFVKCSVRLFREKAKILRRGTSTSVH